MLPVTNPRPSHPTGAALRRRLLRAGLRDVRVDDTTRAAYSSDASLYRVLPAAVAFPRDDAEVAAAVHAARVLGLGVTARGAGTSVAGNAIGPGLVLDFSRHLDAVLAVDPEARTARVRPGVVHASLQHAAAPHGLRFGPDPSTHTRCTIGGMIGNDACGSRALGYGRTAENVEALTLITGTGEVLRTSRLDNTHTADGCPTQQRELKALVARALEPVRTELGRFHRQISGYALHQLLPENDFDLTRMLVGSEGTLGIVTEATVRLVRSPAHRVLVTLGYPDIATAGEATALVLPYRPIACEGLDSRIVDVVRERKGPAAVPDLPRGAAWLLVELAGDDRAELLERAAKLAAGACALRHRIVADPAEQAALWRIREDGGGLAGRAPSGRPAWAGWEDAAVPPAELGGYLRAFDALLAEHGLTAMPFGHFGEGCIHVRLDFPLDRPDGPAAFRRFLTDAADLVAAHGGTLSGEHGDGRARGELLPRVYSRRVLDLFAEVKSVFDPDGILNPGVLIDPRPLDADLRVPTARPPEQPPALLYPADDGDFSAAVHRCTGVAKCRTVARGPGTVMCPSYAATREEKDSTRGRARVLQEMLNGELIGGWRSPAVADALDLCLGCKGCASDCPTGIDMAAYKAEALHQKYRCRPRPRSHYTLGRLPMWAKLAARAPRLVNALLRTPGLRHVALAGAGVDARRGVPAFARTTARAAARKNPPDTANTDGRPVVVFLDSFTEHFAPEVAEDVLAVLVDAGYTPTLTSEEVCCGLTWISTGQLDEARRRLARSVAVLDAAARADVPVVGIEPSCTTALRHDAVELLGTDAARRVAAAMRTLAELLVADSGWTPPDLTGLEVVAQPHCHQHAVGGWDAEARLLADAGARVRRVGGCCGLAGNFGVERGHYDVSVAVAEQQLLPALDGAGPDAVFLADGFSCRTQAADLRDRTGFHLAQLLRGAARGDLPAPAAPPANPAR
ncbi:FAD-binding and (Fe-S)-binding domain-containing protein [Streptomyces sp. MUM 2J]|uniref:FAD-binding and (Fe-S)-binding domain-containing protein n=1 Tax=Streptomyces sp. MUM 2J TaxID=2791987 RepID=UPI0035AC1F2F|nr:FAD-binding oxidoreductase [Streptomyces sp. MUM 2J]